ncbi:uncharacterized protein LOC144620648 [Crassostrea virginica]
MKKGRHVKSVLLDFMDGIAPKCVNFLVMEKTARALATANQICVTIDLDVKIFMTQLQRPSFFQQHQHSVSFKSVPVSRFCQNIYQYNCTALSHLFPSVWH